MVLVTPVGSVIFKLKVHLSPYCTLAVGGTLSSQKAISTGWFTPVGFGAALTKEYVGIVHGGVCAMTAGISAISPDNDSSRIRARAKEVLFPNLFFGFLNLLFSPYFCWAPFLLFWLFKSMPILHLK
jgi:hypothetical protein